MERLSLDQRMKRALPFEATSALTELFGNVRDEEYPDPNAEYDFLISSAGDHGRSACGAFAGALWLFDHATVFLRALKRHRSNRPAKSAEMLENSAGILRALAEEIELPEQDNTLEIVSRIFVNIGVTISNEIDSTDWELKQRQKIESFAEQASFSFSGTGNELYILPWAFEIERSNTLLIEPLESRIQSLRRIIPKDVRSHALQPGELNMWAYFLLLIGKWRAATPMATIATEMKALPAHLDTLGWAHFFESNIEKSIDLLTSAIKMHEAGIGAQPPGRAWSDWAEVGYHKIYVLIHRGRTEDASVLLKRMNDLAPDSFWTHKAQDLATLVIGLDQKSQPPSARGAAGLQNVLAGNTQTHISSAPRSGDSYEFDIALSFAGEDRLYAVQLAERLQAKGITVFYDEFEKAELWGKNLYSHLSEMYQNRAKYCLMLLSKNYGSKPWPRLEREAAQARAFISAKEYILPIRIDDSPIPGIFPTIGYLDWQREGPDHIVDALCRKLFK
jgi:hypothetical protein